ncbi:MAG: plasmid pRiA4b ORF-3 family protein [Kiritimatiellae bacterium]|nr:plasmid pRiA4b ORF-3 family protein [Kiritimatiellia bacterium]
MKLLILKCNWRNCESTRTIAVPAESTLAELHMALQEAFGWEDEHLYAFRQKKGCTWSPPFYDDGSNDADPWETKLCEVFVRPRTKLEYEYDFGDSNYVQITFQKAMEGESPVCLDATGLMAVEDSASFGYVDGIAEILLAGSSDEMYNDCADWMGIETKKDVQDWLASQKADAGAITASLERIYAPKPARRRKRQG